MARNDFKAVILDKKIKNKKAVFVGLRNEALQKARLLSPPLLFSSLIIKQNTPASHMGFGKEQKQKNKESRNKKTLL